MFKKILGIFSNSSNSKLGSPTVRPDLNNLSGLNKLHTVPAAIKDAASIQKLFFEHTHYDAFYPKLFTRLS